MFNFDKSDLQRIAISSIGAIAISTACLVGVAGPVRAATSVASHVAPIADITTPTK